jgi:hypothetical protein
MQLQKPLMLELRVSLCDGVWAYHQLLSQCPNARKLVAILQHSALYCMTDLLHQLQIEGLAARWLQSEDHAETVSLVGYSCTVFPANKHVAIPTTGSEWSKVVWRARDISAPVILLFSLKGLV